VLTVTALTDGEYLLSSVALGIDEDYAGVGAVGQGVRSHLLGAEVGVAAVGDGLRAGRRHGHGRPS